MYKEPLSGRDFICPYPGYDKEKLFRFLNELEDHLVLAGQYMED
jgi:hypothetical protein